ncbi:MAG: hypothetical protein KDD61_10795 [Bdellovibrionales bacterium]|nr:hypothetical protein [Bdellovibrionales bacterium]
MMKKTLLSTVLFIQLFSFAVSADDLLSILESKKSESIVQERDELTEALRKSVGKATAEQNIFFGFLQNSDYEKALFQWWPAFDESSFSRTPTGVALFGYLLVKNKLPVMGVENLFTIQEPRKVLPSLMKVIKLELPVENSVWKQAEIKWQESWTDIFETEIEVMVRAHQQQNLAKINQTYELLKKTKVGTQERYWIEWQMVLGLALNGDTEKAGKVLAHLIKSDQNVVDQGLLYITAARMLFESGYLAPAITYYDKVPRTSEYWFVAQEEKAWSFIRKGEPQNTLAVTQGVILPEFSAYIGPELLFLRSLAQLKVCDYPAVAETLVRFKTHFRQRVVVLSKLSQHGKQPASDRLIETLFSGKTSLMALKDDAKVLPQYVSRDDLLVEKVETLKALLEEERIAGQLYSRSLQGGSAKVGFQAALEQFKAKMSQRVQGQRASIYSHLEKSAAEEVTHIGQILQKMHIVEAEVLQQISLAERVAKESGQKVAEHLGSTGAKTGERLRFPYDGELWFDEISHYKVDIKKGCQAKR